MNFSYLINKFNKGDISLESLLCSIYKDYDKEYNTGAVKYFVKDIQRKVGKISHIDATYDDNDSVCKFYNDNNELFRFEKKPFNILNSNDSLLKTTAYPCLNNENCDYEISNDQFILGTNGLYEHLIDDNYRYITFDKKDEVYYIAYVDKENGIIKKSFYKGGGVNSNYFYTFTKKSNDVENLSSAINKVSSFLDSDFPKLKSSEYRREFSDLIDQNFYNIKLNNKTKTYKDLYLVRNSNILITPRDDKYLYGTSIKGTNNRNKEDFIAITNPSNKNLKLLCVTDFANDSKLSKSYKKYICNELSDWFINLESKELKSDKFLINSLTEKIINLNKNVYNMINDSKIKSDYKKSIFGSSLGLALISSDRTYYINYGDTRLCLDKDGVLEALTIDDNSAWDLYKTKQISKEEAESYQRGSTLTNYVGKPINNINVPEFSIIPNDSYDKLFVFSDGITDNINSITLSSIIKANNSNEVLREIAFQAYRNQSRHDDITGCCYIKK